MSNSRRGLLAAGLAAAVVGSMGTVWTLTANADEAPAAETPAAATASVAPVTEESAPVADESAPADTEAAPAPEGSAPAGDESAPAAKEAPAEGLVPPKLLPWGAKPQPLKRARNGVDSAAVGAADADFASIDTSGSLVPKAGYAPKGRQTFTRTSRSPKTAIAPPAPPQFGLSAKAADENKFYYQGAHQFGDTDGTWANLSIARPELHKDDNHTLTEITVQSADGRQIVEVGWNIDRDLYGDADPHLFVFYWHDRIPECYNDCGFERAKNATIKPSDTLPTVDEDGNPISKRFGIQHLNNAWWIAYDSAWVGAFPDALWNGKYTRGGLTQWFGEVATTSLHPCSDMGNGKYAENGSAARVGTIGMTNGPIVNPVMRDEVLGYTSDLRPGNLTFRYGGPGPGITQADGTCKAPPPPTTAPTPVPSATS